MIKALSERCSNGGYCVPIEKDRTSDAIPDDGRTPVGHWRTELDRLRRENEALRAEKAERHQRAFEAVRAADAPVVQINVPALAPKLRGTHVHPCPECYEKVPCAEVCSLEYGLFAEGETPCGSYAVCDGCEAKKRSADATGETASEEVSRMVHAFGDEGRKQAVRDLADRVRRLEADRDQWLNWAADNQELHERATKAAYERGLREGAQRRERDCPPVQEATDLCAHPEHKQQAIKYEHIEHDGTTTVARWCGACGSLRLGRDWHAAEKRSEK